MDTTDELPRRSATQGYDRTIKSIKDKAPKTQREKFEKAARELETDDREEAFDRALKKIAKTPPPKDSEKKSDR